MAHLLTTVRPAVTDTGLLALRLAVAAVFIAHGAGDVFDAGVSNNVRNYADAGIPVPELAAPFAAYIQLCGGMLLVAGALVRPLAVGFIVVMAGALLFVHRGEGLVMGQDGSGSGYAFIMGVASLTLLLLGPGRFSLDALLVRWRDRPAGATRSVRASRA